MQEEKPIINIAGEKVALGPTHKGLLPFFEKWDNDFSVSIMSGDPLRPVTREAIEADFERHSKEEQHRAVDFVIYEYTTMRLIGITGLRYINFIHRNAEFSIYIGERDCWGKGYGTETTILVLDYGFTILGLHNIILRTYGYNERAIRAYTRASFREMGRWREAARVGDRRYDIVYMDCLSTEFSSPLKRIIEFPGTKH